MGKMGINDNNFNASVLGLNIDKFIEINKNNVYNSIVINNYDDSKDPEVIKIKADIIKKIANDQLAFDDENEAKIKKLFDNDCYLAYKMYESVNHNLNEIIAAEKAFFDMLMEDYGSQIEKYIDNIKEAKGYVFSAEDEEDVNGCLGILSQYIRELEQAYDIENDYREVFKALFSRKTEYLECKNKLITCLRKNLMR